MAAANTRYTAQKNAKLRLGMLTTKFNAKSDNEILKSLKTEVLEFIYLCNIPSQPMRVRLYRLQVSQQFSSDTRSGRTLVGRVMELLVESGVVYTGIWVWINV